MRSLLIPRRWTSQPQFATGINWANPITQGLVDVIDFRYSIPRSLILGTPATSFGTKPSLSVSNSARCMDTTAAFGGWYFTRSDGAYTNAQCTHVAVANYVLQSGIYAGLFVVCDSAGSNNSFGVQYYDATRKLVYPGGYTAYLNAFGQGWGVVAATANTTSTTLYWNGVPTGSTTNTPAALSTSRLILFGEAGLTPTYSTEGQQSLHLVFNRPLSPAEVASISANPWQIFSPALC